MIQTASLGRQIENELREEILAGRLSPGQRISIDTLAAQWGTSSTPVRDAVKRLADLGFLRIAPRSGVFVAELDARKLEEIFELRIALECMAVTKAATPTRRAA